MPMLKALQVRLSNPEFQIPNHNITNINICTYPIQNYERMNLADALVSKTYEDGEQIIKQGMRQSDGLRSWFSYALFVLQVMPPMACTSLRRAPCRCAWIRTIRKSRYPNWARVNTLANWPWSHIGHALLPFTPRAALLSSHVSPSQLHGMPLLVPRLWASPRILASCFNAFSYILFLFSFVYVLIIPYFLFMHLSRRSFLHLYCVVVFYVVLCCVVYRV